MNPCPRGRTILSHYRLLVCLALLSLVTMGCAGYRYGNLQLFRPDVRSVYVPIVESDSLRRGLGLRLTEAIVREIQTRSPYRIASEATADSVLTARITSDRKHVLAENINDDPRELQIDLVAEAVWTTRAGAPLMQRVAVKINDNVAFIPEGGQSMATAQQELIEDLAQQIVDQMEAAW